jgi:predicted MPP superfamily phosphohydrolase
MVKKGHGFEILFNNFSSAVIDTVILEGPYNRVILRIDSVNTGRFEYDSYTHNSTNNRIWVSVPESSPEEMYDLIVKSNGEKYVSLHSVKVVNDFNTRHKFIHITDLHISRQWVGKAEDGYAKELELLDNFIEVANIINPDFIIITGDNIHDYTRFHADGTGWGGNVVREAGQLPLVEEKWKNYYEGAKGFSGIHGFYAPTFSVPGNHDFYGVEEDNHMAKAAQWNDLCGKRVYGFSYAGTRVMVSDDFLGDPLIDIPEKSPMSGLQGEVLESFLEESGKGKIHIMAQHRHNRIDTAFCDKHQIAILLNGHSHKPFYEYLGATPTISIRPGTVSKSGCRDPEHELGYFRIFNIDGKEFEYSPALRFCKDPSVPYQDLEPQLTLGYEKPNDGTSAYNKATIENKFPIDLPGCKIRFIMKKGNYDVSGGIISQVIEAGKFSIVDVKLDVDSDRQAIVDIDRK